MSDASQTTPSAAAASPPAPDGGGAFAFSPEREEKFQEIVRRYPTNTSAIMPTLWLCQEEWGYLKQGIPEWVAERLEVPVARVYEIITFYTMYYTEDPGKYNLQVCRNVSCHLMGCRKIIEHLSEKLGIRPGETDAEGLFRLEEVECLAGCGAGPVMQVGKVYHENLTVEKVDELIAEWRKRG
jgi:NADH-quinone oxidoreductase E subunit